MNYVPFAAGVLFLCAGAASAGTYTLDFTGSGIVPNGYGNNAQASLFYRSIDPAAYGDVGTTGAVSFWGTGYGDLDGAVWGNPNPSHGEIRIEATDPSETVTLLSFDMGGWSADEVAEWFIYDLAWGLVDSGGGIAPNTGAHLSVAPGSGAIGGLIFQWGGDAWDVGVENFRYSVSGVVVPLPATALMLMGGMGVLAGLRRFL
jgi:hypothetical protein